MDPDVEVSPAEAEAAKRSFSGTFDTLVAANLALVNVVGPLIKVVGQLVKLSYVLILIQAASLLYMVFWRR